MHFYSTISSTSSGLGTYIFEQWCTDRYSDPISSYSWRLIKFELGLVFANFFAPFQASAEGYLAVRTLNDDLKGLISFKSFSSLLLIPDKHDRDPVKKTSETNLDCSDAENFLSMNSIVSDIPACSWPMIDGWNSISDIRICSVARCSWYHSGESLHISFPPQVPSPSSFGSASFRTWSYSFSKFCSSSLSVTIQLESAKCYCNKLK